MSDKGFTPASGAAYEVRRNAAGRIEVRKAGEAGPVAFSLELEREVIDAQTKRLRLGNDEQRRLFWLYARGNKRVLSWPGGSIELDASDLTEGAAGTGGATKPLKLTMPGKVLSVKIKEGDIVEAGQGLVIVEAMKMENLLLAPARAKVLKVHVREGDRLESGAVLVTFGSVD